MTSLCYLYLSFSDVVGNVEDKYIYGWLFNVSMIVLLLINTIIYLYFTIRLIRLYCIRYHNRYADWKEKLIAKYPLAEKFTNFFLRDKIKIEAKQKSKIVSKSILKKKKKIISKNEIK